MTMTAQHTTATRAPAWWGVLLPGEEPEIYGPFRSFNAARASADQWNESASFDDLAYVIPIRPSKELK